VTHFSRFFDYPNTQLLLTILYVVEAIVLLSEKIHATFLCDFFFIYGPHKLIFAKIKPVYNNNQSRNPKIVAVVDSLTGGHYSEVIYIIKGQNGNSKLWPLWMDRFGGGLWLSFDCIYFYTIIVEKKSNAPPFQSLEFKLNLYCCINFDNRRWWFKINHHSEYHKLVETFHVVSECNTAIYFSWCLIQALAQLVQLFWPLVTFGVASGDSLTDSDLQLFIET